MPPDRRLVLKLSAVAFCALFTIVLWFPALSTDALWGDEVMALNAAQSSLGNLVRERYGMAHSPVYYILLKLWLIVTTGGSFEPGQDEWLVRLPSLLMMAGAGALIVAAAFRSWGAPSASLAAFLWPCSMYIGRYAVETRPYALLILWIALALWANVQAIRDRANSRRFRILSAVGSVGAVTAMPLGAVAVAAMEASIFATQRFRSDRTFRDTWLRSRWITWGAVAGIIAVLARPIALAAADNWADEAFAFDLDRVLATLRLSLIAPNHRPWPVVLAGGVVAAFATKPLFSRRAGDTAILAAALFILVPLLMLAMSTQTNLLVVRYFLPAAPGLVLLAATGMVTAPMRRASTALGVAAVAVLAVGSVNYRDSTMRMDILPLARFAESQDLRLGNTVSLGWAPIEPGLLYLGDRVSSITETSLTDLEGALPESTPLWILEEDWNLSDESRFREISATMTRATVCGFQTRSVAAYVATRKRTSLPPSLKKCEGMQDLWR